jgi:hypothetical protein
MSKEELGLYELWRSSDKRKHLIFTADWRPAVRVAQTPAERAMRQRERYRLRGQLPNGQAICIKNLTKKTFGAEGGAVAAAEWRHGMWWSAYAKSLPDTAPSRKWIEACNGNPLPFLWLILEARRQKKLVRKRASRRKLRNSPHTRSYIVERVRKRMAKAIKEGKGMKSGTSRDIIGCDWGALRAHLEAGFTERMSWSNYGQYGWHIDHIEPLARFDMRDPAQVRKAWHYTNLQPLWWTDNLAKLDSFEFERVPGGCVQTLTN